MLVTSQEFCMGKIPCVYNFVPRQWLIKTFQVFSPKYQHKWCWDCIRYWFFCQSHWISCL